MTLRINVFGIEIAKIDLDFHEVRQPRALPVDRGVKVISKWWSERMTS